VLRDSARVAAPAQRALSRTRVDKLREGDSAHTRVVALQLARTSGLVAAAAGQRAARGQQDEADAREREGAEARLQQPDRS
jgi:hypothetical protein